MKRFIQFVITALSWVVVVSGVATAVLLVALCLGIMAVAFIQDFPASLFGVLLMIGVVALIAAFIALWSVCYVWINRKKP